MTSVSETLRAEIIKSDLTHYRLSQLSGVDTKVIDRFMSGERATLRSDTVDRLCTALKLKLVAASDARRRV